MKATLRIPTNEQFAFIEIEKEVNSSQEAIEAYNEAMGYFKASDGGLNTKEWNDCLVRYLESSEMDSDYHERMNKAQSWMIHEIDKAFNRIKNKE